jgi:DNA-binding CsgD family transcriptional regulator
MDEAMAAIGAGEVSDDIVGRCLCVMLAACQRAADLRRADQWTTVLLERLAPGGGMPRIVRTECRVAYGALLRSVGRWNEADTALLDALTPTASRSTVLRVAAASELADLRVGQGRLEEAAALLRPHNDRLEITGALARLHLARSEPALATAAITRALRQLVDDRLRQGELLALLVESELAQGDLGAAGAAAERLAGVAAEVEGPALRAEAALARARVAAARGAHDSAITHLEHALHVLPAGESPLLRGVVHLELAHRLADSDARVANAIIEARAALAIFERLGARTYVHRTAALLRQLGDSERPRGPSSPADGSPLTGREVDVLDLVRRGLTNAQIGERLYISPKTAEHHVSSILDKLGARTRAEAAALSIAK